MLPSILNLFWQDAILFFNSRYHILTLPEHLTACHPGQWFSRNTFGSCKCCQAFSCQFDHCFFHRPDPHKCLILITCRLYINSFFFCHLPKNTSRIRPDLLGINPKACCAYGTNHQPLRMADIELNIRQFPQKRLPIRAICQCTRPIFIRNIPRNTFP